MNIMVVLSEMLCFEENCSILNLAYAYRLRLKIDTAYNHRLIQPRKWSQNQRSV